MLNVSTAFQENIYAQNREFRSRVTIFMDAFSQKPPITDELHCDFTNKTSGNITSNPHIAKFIKNATIQIPSAFVTELSDTYYPLINTANFNDFDVDATVTGNKGQILFQFNPLSYIESIFGKEIWKGAVNTADKVAIARKFISNIRFNWTGYGQGSVATTTNQTTTTTTTPSAFSGIRYIRDYLNGSTTNAYNYWNEIQANTSGGVNRCAVLTPTISSGTMTNIANVTDGNATTYGYESSGNGVLKYLQIDLGAVYSDIANVKIIHYYVDGRTFHGTKTQVSSDGVNWTTLFDSAVSGEYAETSAGKTYTPAPVTTTTTTPVTTYASQNNAIIGAWDDVAQNYVNSVTSAATQETLSSISTTNANILANNGFVQFVAYCNLPAGGGIDSEVLTDYVECYIDFSFATVRQYFDDIVMDMDCLEEMSVLNDQLPANELKLTLNNTSGEFDILNMSNYQSIIASRPMIRTELGLVLPDGSIEWIPSGVYFMNDWKNDTSSKIISFTGRDYFDVFSNTTYTPAGKTNLHDLAVDILTTAGVPTYNQIIDPILSNYTVNDFQEALDCRTAIQHVGIIGMVTVGQDREGNVFLKTFATLDEASNYTVYTSSQNMIYHYIGSNLYPLNATAGGMKEITFDEQFDPPTVTLEKSIYQLVLKTYPTGPANDSTDYKYTNPLMTGNNGQSFQIDNPLVITKAQADAIANWYFKESNYNASYQIRWRQNPALEVGDLVLVVDSFGADKQSRITQHELSYTGYLEGVTQTRGGV
jgi:hypothetical protein